MVGKRNDSATNVTPTTVNLESNKSVNAKSVYGGLIAGYLFRFQNFGIGPEFFYNYGNIENTISGQHNEPGPVTTAFDIKHRITYQTGINSRFGYFWENYFLYTLVGLHFQAYNYFVKARQDRGAGHLLEYTNNTKNRKTTGVSFGVGLQKQINENYDVGLEYKLINIPKRNYEYDLRDPDELKLTSDIKYKIHSIGLRFIYKF